MSEKKPEPPVKLKLEEVRFWDAMFIEAWKSHGNNAAAAKLADSAVGLRRKRIQQPKPEEAPYRRNLP